jgi:hypothetical protein
MFDYFTEWAEEWERDSEHHTHNVWYGKEESTSI